VLQHSNPTKVAATSDEFGALSNLSTGAKKATCHGYRKGAAIENG